MRCLIAGLLLVSTVLDCGAEPPVIAERTIDADKACAAIESILNDTEVPAISAAIADADEVLVSCIAGVRVARGSSEVGVDEPFHIGSCTKAMTATLIAMLVEDGLLRWDMTLAEAFPDLADEMNERYKPVTIAALLRHRAGIASFTSGVAPEVAMLGGLEGDARTQRGEFARRVLTADPGAPVGEFLYSNGGYGVASAIAERVTDESWEDLMRERVFEPLGMTTAGFGWPSTGAHPAAPRGHYADPKFEHRPQALDDSYELPTALDAAGDVYCSSADLVRFAQWHLRGALGRDGLLRSETLKELHRPDGDYAAGWGVISGDGVTLISHDGSAGTFYTRVSIRPDLGLCVVASSNTGAGMEACARACDELVAMTTTP